MRQRTGKQAHLDDKLIKVGRVAYKSWATEVLKVADICVYESTLIHIYKRHGKELKNIGLMDKTGDEKY